MSSQMSPRERVFAALANKEFDYYPAITPTSVANIQCMKQCGSYFPKAHTNPEMMAALSATSHTVLGFDSVMPYFSVHLEASALGCKVNWGSAYNMPYVTQNPVRKIEDFHFSNAFLSRPECKSLLSTIRMLKASLGKEVVIFGKVIGPWTLAYHLYGVENLILDTILEPDRIRAFIEALLPISIQFAKAQYEAGADVLTWADHVTSDLISAKIYREFMLPVHKKAAAQLKSYGPVVIHICGNLMDRLMDLGQTNFTALHLDSRNNITKAANMLQGKMTLVGSVNNPITLTSGNNFDIQKEVQDNIRAGCSLISPECAVPMKVSTANLKTLVETAHRTKHNSI